MSPDIELLKGAGIVSLEILAAKLGGKVLDKALDKYSEVSGDINSTDIGMTFGNGIQNQGKPYEAYVQSSLPQGTLDLNSIKQNFSTFDHLTPDGIAVSTKTLDTSASSYQNPSKSTYQLNKYINMNNVNSNYDIEPFLDFLDKYTQL